MVMKSVSVNDVESHAVFHRPLSNKSVINRTFNPYYNLSGLMNLSPKDDSGTRCSPTLVYDNPYEEADAGDSSTESTDDGLHQEYDYDIFQDSREMMTRDWSLLPAKDGLINYGDNTVRCQDKDGSPMDLYDSVITHVSSMTPPPTQMTHEYDNRKAIIRPLAFRPVPGERSQNQSTCSTSRATPVPTGSPGMVVQNSSSGQLFQSHNSGGDSSGFYYLGTTDENTSSPTLDAQEPMIDSLSATTADPINNHQGGGPTDTPGTQTSLESQINAERERSLFLESALLMSNARQISAEGLICELKMRLLQKSAEVNKTKETFGMINRALEHQTLKARDLEKCIKSMQSMKSEVVVKDKGTQVNLCNNDLNITKLMEQFEEERNTWLDEKLKVLMYQRRVETIFQKMQLRYRHLERQLVQFQGQVKECPQSSKHTEDHENGSLNSADSTNRNYCANRGE